MSAEVGRTQKLGALLARDLRVVVRDPLLVLLVFYGLVIAAVARFVVPLIPVDDLGLYLAPAVPLIGVLLVGSIFGLLIVEERESRTWLLLRVLPVSDTSLTGYLFLLTAALALISAFASAAVYGQPVVRPAVWAGGIAAAALCAPLLAFSLGAVASNKIEAMALGKAMNLPVVLPILAFVVPDPWHRLLWWDPFYWVYLALLRGHASGAALEAAPLVDPALSDALVIGVAIVLILAACAALVRRVAAVRS